MPMKPPPGEMARPATFREIRTVLLGAFALVLVANAAACWRLRRFDVTGGTRLITQKWELLHRLRKPVDWLIVGDSCGLCSMDPEIIREKYGASALNLCVTAYALPVNTAWMLENYVKRFGAPKVVIVPHVYDVWEHGHHYADFRFILSKMPLPWGAWKRMKPRPDFTWREKRDIFLTRYVPLYGENDSMSKLLKFPWKIVQSFRLLVRKPSRPNDDGFRPISRSNPAMVEKDYRWHLQYATGRQFKMADSNRRALQRIVDLAEEHAFDVYLVDAPIYEGLLANKSWRPYYDQVRATLDEIASQSRHVRHIPARPIAFPQDQMQNCDHIIAASVKGYMDALLSAIRNPPG